MIATGQLLPRATVYEMVNGELKTHNTEVLWGQGATIIFGLPGAFTPVCTTQHVPGFVEHQDALHRLGIREVFCLAVNDAFVLDAWQRSLNAPSFVRFISDGNGELTRLMGLEMDGSSLGFGVRCQRFVLRVQDGVVLYCSVEENFRSCGITHASHIISILNDM